MALRLSKAMEVRGETVTGTMTTRARGDPEAWEEWTGCRWFLLIGDGTNSLRRRRLPIADTVLHDEQHTLHDELDPNNLDVTG